MGKPMGVQDRLQRTKLLHSAKMLRFFLQVDYFCDVVRFLLDKQRGLSDQARTEAKRNAGKITAVLPQLIQDKKHGW